MEKLIFKSYADLSIDIKKNLHLISQENFELVVGIPRSGMVPAYMISAYLNIDCTDLDSFINNAKLQRGITRTTKASLTNPHDANKILLVDDSVYSGKSMKLALDKIDLSVLHKIKTLAIYVHTDNPSFTDYCFEKLDGKKLFEWGIFHNNIISNCCFDIDGVLCRDPLPEEDEEELEYQEFLKNAEPLFLPTGTIHSLVTNRLEKYRELTEEWLKRHNIKYDYLVMVQLSNKEDKNLIDSSIDYKAKYYQKSNTELFIESSLFQAEKIAVFSGKPVYCIESNTFIDPTTLNKILHNPSSYFTIQKNYWKHKIKIFLKPILPQKYKS
jgi:uncharacterized HAD superfamily protein/predicted phosphoribosyltransferase